MCAILGLSMHGGLQRDVLNFLNNVHVKSHLITHVKCPL